MGLLKLLLGAVTLAITLGTSRPAWAAQESGISAGEPVLSLSALHW
jgi:hypothetical protein